MRCLIEYFNKNKKMIKKIVYNINVDIIQY